MAENRRKNNLFNDSERQTVLDDDFALSKNSYTQPYIDQLEALVAKVTFQNPDSSYLVRADGNNEAQVASATIAKTETKAENFSEDKDTTNTLE